ncbi:MAG: ATP-binding protein [Bacilli bacterium]|jgi:signal transduction histidine kinase/CheY-like chemotaxis protein|nr:ATP-binding protein [Bacilli bacterium]
MTKQTWKRLILIVLNVLALGAMTATLFIRLNSNSQAIKNQNVQDVGNIAKSYTNISTSLFTTRQETITNLISSVDYFKLDYQGCLTYLSQMQTSEGEFEIVGLDYKGYSTAKNSDGTYKEIAYTASSYTSLKAIFDKAGATALDSPSIPLTPEFSDAITSLRSVGVFAYFNLSDGTTTAPYTLLSVSSVASNEKDIRIQTQYPSLSFVICDSQGNYLVSDSSFGSDNFFNALYTNNGLTLDKKNALIATFSSQQTGNFEYLNSQGKTCLYSYCQSSDPNLYIIVSVPESEFVGSMTNFWFAFGYVVALAVIFIVDFVYVMNLNRTLREKSKAVESANKSKTYFMSQISHDMRTPMNVIIGMSRFIQDSNDMKEIKEYNANVLKSSEYLLSLINDTLDIFRMESGRYELKKTVSTMANVLSVVSLEIQKLAEKKGITFLEKKNGDFTLPILVDDLKTRQLLINLLNNAVKFTGKDGHVSFAASQESFTEKTVVYRFIIADTGPGMSEEFMTSMYQPFVQEGRQKKEEGTGLGLSIAKRITDVMGGKITCASVLDKGTTFTVDLPFERTVSPTQAIEAVSQPAPTKDVLKGKHVLLVEDNLLNQEIGAKLLSMLSMEVSLANNGQEALDLYSKKPAYYDVILMDIMMPVMDGKTATREIRKKAEENGEHPLVLAMTADVYNSDDPLFDGIIIKPVDPKILKESLTKVILAKEEATKKN